MPDIAKINMFTNHSSVIAQAITRRSQISSYAGVVGHIEAVRDALEDVRVADAPAAVDDFADPALAEADRGADACLAEPGVLVDQRKERSVSGSLIEEFRNKVTIAQADIQVRPMNE